MSKKIAYAIARESADDRTLQNQYENIEKVAKKFGYTIVKRFGENVSGDVTKNAGADPNYIEELRASIKKKKPDAIFCYRLDRLTRTTYKQGSYLDEFSAKGKIPICFTADERWTIDPLTGKIDDDYMQNLAADLTPQRERENITKRTRPQREKLGSEGYYIGHLSDGFCVKEEWGIYEDGRRRKIKTIEIDEDRKGVIVTIYDYYLKGYSTDQIAMILNVQGISTTNKYRSEHHDKFGHKAQYIGKDGIIRERNESTWSGSLVAQILSNEWYKGIRHYKGKELSHPYIIEPSIWNDVEKMRLEKKINSIRNSSKHIFLLSNLFYCGKCGKKMYGHYTGLNNHYYCSSVESSSEKCGLKGICKENIEGIIFDMLLTDAYFDLKEGLNTRLSEFFRLGNEKKKEIEETIKTNQTLIQHHTDEVASLKLKIRFYAEKQADYIGDDERLTMYDDLINEATKKMKSYILGIERLKEENEKFENTLKKTSKVKEALSKLYEKKELTTIRDLFQSVIDSVKIYNTEKKNSVIRFIDKNGIGHEFIYSSSKLPNKYLPLSEDYHYNETINLIEHDFYPILITSDGRYLYSENGFSDRLLGELKTNGIGYSIFNGAFSVDAFIDIARYSSALGFQRLEGLSDLAIQQKEYYKEWRKKYNNGRPTNEPYVLKNSTYEHINKVRKKLYNRKYKLIKNKLMAQDDKFRELIKIDKELAELKRRVPRIESR